MTEKEWMTAWISVRFSAGQGEISYLRWYAPLRSDLVLVLPDDDPLLRHLVSDVQSVYIAPVAARGMSHASRDYTPAIAAIAGKGDADRTEALRAMRAKYRWRWVVERFSRGVGGIVQGGRSNTVVRVTPTEPPLLA